MKSKIRARQNGGSKPGNSQARNRPNQPAPAPNGAASPLKPESGSGRAAPLYYRLADRRREVNQLAETLGLTPGEGKVLLLLAQWEGLSPTEFCRMTVQAFFQSSFDDLKHLATARDEDKDERQWALKFFPRVATLFEKGGAR